MGSLITFFLFLLNLVISTVSIKWLAQRFNTARPTWNGAIITLVLNIIFSILTAIGLFIASLVMAFLFDGGQVLMVIVGVIASLLASGQACAIGVRTTLMKGTGIMVLNYIIMILMNMVIVFSLTLILGATVFSDLQSSLGKNQLGGMLSTTSNTTVSAKSSSSTSKKQAPKKLQSFTEKQQKTTAQYHVINIADLDQYKGYFIRISRYNDEPLVGQFVQQEPSQLMVQQVFDRGNILRYVPLSSIQSIEVYTNRR